MYNQLCLENNPDNTQEIICDVQDQMPICLGLYKASILDTELSFTPRFCLSFPKTCNLMHVQEINWNASVQFQFISFF